MLDRTQIPPFVAPKTLQLPLPHKIELPGGVELHHITDLQQEIVILEVLFEAGKWYEPYPCVSYFMAEMLDKGTKSKSSTQIATFFDQYGASIEIKSDADFISVTLYALCKHVSTLLPVFLELLSTPNFPESELEQMKDKFIQTLLIKNKKTGYLSNQLISKKVFGEHHPYGRPTEIKAVKDINRDQLNTFFNSYMNPIHVFVLGKMHSQDLIQIEAYIKTTKTGRHQNKTVETTTQKPDAQWVEKKDSVQSSIRLGKRGIPKIHPDYFNLLILNYHLGGYFGSQLMKNLREEKGLTYGISSSISTFQQEGIIVISTDVNKESRVPAIDEIRSEISKVAHGYIEESALQLVKRHFIGQIHSGVASPFAVMEKIRNIALNKLPADYYQSLISHIYASSPSSLRESAKIYFDESSFYEVSVG